MVKSLTIPGDLANNLDLLFPLQRLARSRRLILASEELFLAKQPLCTSVHMPELTNVGGRNPDSTSMPYPRVNKRGKPLIFTFCHLKKI